jgi:multidrug efflux pump subunit AcrB
MDEKKDNFSSDSGYLARLEFRPELRKMWLNFFVTNFRVVTLLIIIISAWGIYSYLVLPRESNPEVTIPIAVVTTIYPGASPSDVEEFVTKKVEAEISGLKGLKKISSNSSNSLSAVTVEFDANQDVESSIRRLRDKIGSVKSKISKDAKDPQVIEISMDDSPIWGVSITGPYDGFTLRKYAEDIKNELEKIPGVREVHIAGGEEREFEIAYIPERLLFYGVSADQANQVIAANNLAIPAGNFETDKLVFPIRSDGRVYDVDAIGAMPVSHSDDGGVIAVRDIAVVSEKGIKKTSYSRASIDGAPPRNSVSLSIIKRAGVSVIDTLDQAKNATEQTMATFPPGMTFDISLDFGDIIKKDFDRLTHDFLLTLLLVFGTLFLIVGLKEAFVAGMAIPLVFFVSFGVLDMLGMTLNFLSVFSLILSLGLLVDDAIVVVSATKQYLNTGKYTPEEAVLLVLNDFKWVLTTTTLATVWAFLPLVFTTGIMGQFIKSIPVTVSITLISSLFIALMINHPLAAVLERMRLKKKSFFLIEIGLTCFAGGMFYMGGIEGYSLGVVALALEGYLIWWYEKTGKKLLDENAVLVEKEWRDNDLIKQKLREQGKREHKNLAGRLFHGIINFNRLLPVYEKYFRYFILDKKRRRMTVAFIVLLFAFSIGLVVAGVVKSEFFPPADMDYVYIDVRTPAGTALSETDNLVKRVEEKLLAYPDISNFSTVVGRASAGTQISVSSNNSSNLGSVTLTLKDKGERTHASYALADIIREDLSSIKEGVITVTAPKGGPPSGATFEARVLGDDLTVIKKIVYDLREKLAAVPGVVNIDVSQKDSVPEYTFVLDPVKLEQHYLNSAYVGSVLRMAVSGVEVATIVKNDKEIKLIATFSSESLPDLASLQNMQILNLRKQPVYLKDVATIKLEPSVEAIARMDQKRSILLSAGNDSTTNGPAILAQFKTNIADYKMPNGYSIVYGGENEQNTESVVSIIRAMFIALVLIVATLVIQFNSFKKALIVLAPIPLALIGVFLGMAIFDVSLSFPGLIGVLALFGIVVKNAIILVDKINININSGIPFTDAIVDAGKSRAEAIFITSICTIFGILPITLSNEMWRSLGGAVIFGLSLSSFLTLFFVPALFLMLIRPDERF